MPRRIKLPDEQVTVAVALKRLRSRKAYAQKTGKKALEKSIDKAIKDITSKKTAKGQQRAIERGLERTSSKHYKEVQKAAAKKRRNSDTFKKHGKQWASDMLDDVAKVFGNDFAYEVAEQIADTPGIGRTTANRMIEVMKSTRSKYSHNELLQLGKTYIDWATNKKLFRDAFGVTNEEELIDYFDGKLADIKARESEQEKKTSTPKKSAQSKKSTRRRS